MMMTPDEPVTRFGKSNQRNAHQWSFVKIEPATPVFFKIDFQLSLLLIERQLTPVSLINANLNFSPDDL
jgi:hypothetical protein